MDKSASYFKFRKAKLKRSFSYIGVLVIILSVTILQDFLHSKFNSYSFYLSESLLFNLFWALLIPIGFGLRYSFQNLSLLRETRSQFLRKILFVFAGSIVHILAYSALIFGISEMFYSHTFGFGKNLIYTISQDLYKYLFIYAAISLVVFRKKKGVKIPPLTSNFPDQLVINSGRTNLIVPINQILYIQASTPYIEIHTAGKKYLHSETLKSILEKLDPTRFLQIHKSTIINLQQVISYNSRLNGDYDVLLQSGQELRLSRNYVNGFKSQFKRISP